MKIVTAKKPKADKKTIAPNGLPRASITIKKKKPSMQGNEGPINLAFKSAVICSLYDDDNRTATETSIKSGYDPETAKTKITGMSSVDTFNLEGFEQINSE